MLTFKSARIRVLAAVLLAAGFLLAAHGQTSGSITPAPADSSAHPPYGIAAKRPLVAGACKDAHGARLPMRSMRP